MLPRIRSSQKIQEGGRLPYLKKEKRKREKCTLMTVQLVSRVYCQSSLGMCDLFCSTSTINKALFYAFVRHTHRHTRRPCVHCCLPHHKSITFGPRAFKCAYLSFFISECRDARGPHPHTVCTIGIARVSPLHFAPLLNYSPLYPTSPDPGCHCTCVSAISTAIWCLGMNTIANCSET